MNYVMTGLGLGGLFSTVLAVTHHSSPGITLGAACTGVALGWFMRAKTPRKWMD